MKINLRSTKYLVAAVAAFGSSISSPAVAKAVTPTKTVTNSNSEKAKISTLSQSSQKSLSEAISWANSVRGLSIDFDGAYGAQCVDLPMAYSNYLFGTRILGNATDYPYNDYTGFKRLSKEQSKPQAGDIAIWIGGSSGHVGIVIASTGDSFTTLEQNVSGNVSVQEYSRNTSGLYGQDFWGVQRPMLNTEDSIPTVSNKVYRLYNISSGDHYFTTDKEEVKKIIFEGYQYEKTVFSTVTSGVPVYCVYNKVTGEHIYTTEASEVKEYIEKGWNDEGIAWEAPTKGKDVFRLYNSEKNSHLFTSDDNEIKVLLKEGWVKEKVAFKE
ncbi:MAG: CHAP domain-containing protein [Lactovum sp.]